MEQLSMREIELLEEQKKWRYETRDTLKDSKEIFDLLCHLEDFSVQYYELKNTINEAIKDLFELKNMIYKPETREQNFEVQRKISLIIKNLKR